MHINDKRQMYLTNGVALKLTGRKMNAHQRRKRKYWMNQYAKLIRNDMHKFLRERLKAKIRG